MESGRNALKDTPLPRGQRLISEFPRFGVMSFARRRLKHRETELEIRRHGSWSVQLTMLEFAQLQRVTLTADFHCAAGWSYRALQWSGFRFLDVWSTFILPKIDPDDELGLAILRGEDGFRTALPIEDLLAPEVLVADRLDEQPLTVEHGAPIRLIAPAHYGYKSAKHLVSIELRRDSHGYRPLLPRFLDHPRARVAFEERGQLLPGWLSRYVFRPFIPRIIRELKRITADSGR